MLRVSIPLWDGFHVWRSEGDRWVDSGIEQQRGVWFCVGFALSLRPRCRFGIGKSVVTHGDEERLCILNLSCLESWQSGRLRRS